MRLNRLDLTRFGRFTDLSLAFEKNVQGPDLHIIYGPNEAGKSTLFTAWLDLLFGISHNSRYDFLHDGPMMQIGAELEFSGKIQEFKRIKKRERSLLDAHDSPLPETVLQAPLGGISREGYSAMFSLDDETIERGGETILASKGEMGQMLFSASAGLAGLMPQIEAIRLKLNEFYNGQRSGRLIEATKELKELEAKAKGLEVSANELRSLSRACKAAESAWQEARREQQALQQKLDQMNHHLAALPLREKLAQMREQLQNMGPLPQISSFEYENFIQKQRLIENAALRLADFQTRLADLKASLENVSDQDDILGLTAEIAAADAGKSEHDSALKDMPSRKARLDELVNEGQHLLNLLGQAGRRAEDLLIAPAPMSQLRALLHKRSGIFTKLSLTLEEKEKSIQSLKRAEITIGEMGLDERDLSKLNALVTHLRIHNPNENLRQALKDRDQKSLALQEALLALSPWQGGVSELIKLTPIDQSQLESLQQDTDKLKKIADDLRSESESLIQEIADLDAEAAKEKAALPVTLADAARTRSQREALWARHLTELSPQSAQAFEQILREDDRISALLVDSLSQERSAALQDAKRARLCNQLGRCQEHAQRTLQDIAKNQKILETECKNIGLHQADGLRLGQWLSLRETALRLSQELTSATTALDRAKAETDQACKNLTAALGAKAPSQSYDLLWAEAIASLEAAERHRQSSQRLRDLRQDLQDREREASAAQDAYNQWLSAWHSLSEGSFISAYSIESDRLSGVLDALDQLRENSVKIAELKDRIQKMQHNIDTTRSARARVFSTIGMPEDSDWQGVALRLRTAQDNERDRKTLTEQLIRLAEQEQKERDAQSKLQNDLTNFGLTIGWQEAKGPLQDYVSKADQAQKLSIEINDLSKDLAEGPQESASKDHLEDSARQLQAELKVAGDLSDDRYASYLDLRRKIDAIGGDDALARIATQKASVLRQIEEGSRDYLRQKFGLMALETGLRHYRDNHRSSMLAAASDAFSKLSQGAYSGLAAQPSGAQEVLVAKAKTGLSKLAADLSKGTRFQLYLALRIAGYHELAKSNPPVPFIADDIMETFDDARSEAAFGLLAQMAQKGQVIYLTHHRHLCDIALKACPQANILDLTRL